MSLQIVLYPHPVLRRPCETVRQVKKTLRLQIGRMFELMYAAKGIGLAAPQVGISPRILLINLSGNPGDAKSERVLINPVFTARNGLAEEREGCLSLPGLSAPGRRATTVSFQALDLDGKEIRGTFRGLEARALQHEIDHLEGILFHRSTSRLTPRRVETCALQGSKPSIANANLEPRAHADNLPLIQQPPAYKLFGHPTGLLKTLIPPDHVKHFRRQGPPINRANTAFPF
ncbi:MAG: peptide deformylase [Planctomycetota bacterium]